MTFQIRRREITLRTKVVWQSTSSNGVRLVGLRLLLGLCTAATRQRFAEWIVMASRRSQLAGAGEPKQAGIDARPIARPGDQNVGLQ